MKRLIISIFLLLIISGCNNEKKIKCTQNSLQEGYGLTTQDITLYHKNNKATNYEYKIKVSLEDNMKDYLDNFYSSIINSFADYKNKNGITLNNQKDKLSITISLAINLDKINKEDNTLLHFDKEKNIEDIKKSLEIDGYICK
ncbi:MAG: hypothetical protein RRY16_02225 [Bacilli bacterium]